MLLCDCTRLIALQRMVLSQKYDFVPFYLAVVNQNASCFVGVRFKFSFPFLKNFVINSPEKIQRIAENCRTSN